MVNPTSQKLLETASRGDRLETIKGLLKRGNHPSDILLGHLEGGKSLPTQIKYYVPSIGLSVYGPNTSDKEVTLLKEDGSAWKTLSTGEYRKLRETGQIRVYLFSKNPVVIHRSQG